MGKTPFDNFEVQDLPADLHHWRNAFDARFLRVTNLEGKPRTVTIANVQWLKSSNRNESKRQLLVTLSEFEKPWAINVTNSEAIAQLFSNDDPRSWVGKRITLYPTKTKFGPQVVDCIRVRDQLPAAPPGASAMEAQRAAMNLPPIETKPKPEYSERAKFHRGNIAQASLLSHLDTVEEEITEDNGLSQEETAILVRALTKRRAELEAKP